MRKGVWKGFFNPFPNDKFQTLPNRKSLQTTISVFIRMEKGSLKRYKILWEKEKLLVTSNFSFSHSVFKRLVLQTPKNQGLFGKGLMHLQTISFHVCLGNGQRLFCCPKIFLSVNKEQFYLFTESVCFQLFIVATSCPSEEWTQKTVSCYGGYSARIQEELYTESSAWFFNMPCV